MELSILDAGNSKRLIANAKCGDDLVIEPLQTDALVKLGAFKERLKTAAEAKGQRPKLDDLRDFAETLFTFAMPNRLRDVYSRPTEAFSLQIVSNHPGVQELPWEYVITPGAPLIPDRKRRVVRLAESNGSKALSPKKLGGKIRVLYAFADPTTGKPLPTLWIIHDEFADWMQTEDYKDSVPNIVGRLSVKARAAGIFLLFAAQRPDKDVMPMQLRSQLGNRLILKVDNAGTAEIAMGNKNSGAERLLGRGHMLAKTGDTPEPVFVQVPFIDMEDTIPQIVRLIRIRYGRPVEPQP
jgi:hypothetical protein